MLGEAKDPLSKQIKLFNWDNLFHHIIPVDSGLDVIYLEGDEAWIQWDLAVRLLDSKKHT